MIFIQLIFFWLFSELAQKTQAERDAKRVLHEAGVAKKKEIIAKSIAIKSEQQVNLIGYIKTKYSNIYVFRHISKKFNEIYKKLKMN